MLLPRVVDIRIPILCLLVAAGTMKLFYTISLISERNCFHSTKGSEIGPRIKGPFPFSLVSSLFMSLTYVAMMSLTLCNLKPMKRTWKENVLGNPSCLTEAICKTSLWNHP